MAGAGSVRFLRHVERHYICHLIAAAIVPIPIGIALGASERIYRSVEFRRRFIPFHAASAMFPLFLVRSGLRSNQDVGRCFRAALVILFNVALWVRMIRKTRRWRPR